MTRRVLVTGATGFIGRAVVSRLIADGMLVTAAVRSHARDWPGVRVVHVADLGRTTDWRAALADCHAVVHCAARVHVTHDSAHDPLQHYRNANVEGTRALALQASEVGAKRFIFISSIKAQGEESVRGNPYRATDPPRPVDPYGVSKLEAEQVLQDIALTRAIDLTIIRPPLVYGAGVKANFQAMARWVLRGIPLPLGSLEHNRRSLVALDNLVDLIAVCLERDKAIGQLFLVNDGEDLSTAELLRRTASAIGVRVHLVPVPAAMLSGVARLVGRQDLWQRLGGTLQVDATATQDRLSWCPPLSVDEGLRATFAEFRTSRKS